MSANLQQARPLPFEQPLKVAVTEPVSLHCHDNLQAVEFLWREFQRTASTSAYSSFQWCDAWLNTVGQRLGSMPRIIIAYDARGNVAFILPLQLRRQRGLTVLEFLGAPDMQCGFGLFAKSFLPHAPQWFESNLPRVLAVCGKFHVVSLLDMPHQLDGHRHPLSASFSVTCANDSFGLTLGSTFESVYERKRNPETRRANRRKDARLTELGDIRFYEPKSGKELHDAIDVMLDHKVKRLAENGIHGVFDSEEHRMIHMLADAEEAGQRLFKTHVLSLNGDILAVTFGGLMNQTYWFYISSLAPDSAATKFSPGDLALRETICACCNKGLANFDFGAGIAPYKTGWTDTVMNLQGIVRTNSLIGIPWVLARYAKLNVLAVVKRNTHLRTLAFNLRKKLRGQ